MLGANAEPNCKDHFCSPPQSPVSSSYSPLPSPLRDEDTVEVASAALRTAAVDLILNHQSQTHAEEVIHEINAGGSAEPASKDAPKTLLMSVHSQPENNSKDIINLEEVHPVEDATCGVTNHHDTDSLRQYQEVVVAVLGNLKEYEYQREAGSFIKRVSRSAPRLATFQTIRAVIRHFHGSWTHAHAQSQSSSPSNFSVWTARFFL